VQLSQIRRVFRAANAVSPEFAGALALRAFAMTQPRMPLRSVDAATVEAAERDSIRIRDVDVVTYSWGRGDDTVLLVHGWRGRASQFAPLVRELVAEGFHVVAFDAPAHGGSGKDRTDIRDWIAAIDALQQRHGRFRLIVGHSFGALAALAAVRAGTTTTRVATIAGTGTPQVLFDQFAAILGLAPRAKDAFLRRFHRRLDIDPEEMTRRFDSVAHPLPAHVDLLAIHDDTDLQMPVAATTDLVAAHADQARFVRTHGHGHNRLLAVDVTLDAVVAFANGGLARIDTARAGAGSAD